MADIKINQLPNLVTLNDTDYLIAENVAQTQKMTVAQLKEFLGIQYGGIEDSGTNVNGSYIKFKDGTLLMWGLTPNEPISVAIGSGFRTVAITSTLPETLFDFTKARIITSAQNYAIATGNVQSNTTITTAMLSFDNGRNSAVHWQVIGRWKA